MQFKSEVRTDADYGEIPVSATFDIDAETAKDIVRLSKLVKHHQLHCLEKFDYRVRWDWEEDDGSTDAERLVVFGDEFCFSAWVKHTNVEIHTARHSIEAIAQKYGLALDDEASSVEAFVRRVARMDRWDCADSSGALLQECEPPTDGHRDSHAALMSLIVHARALCSSKPVLEEREAPALVLAAPEESGASYILQSDSPSCWIMTGSISVHIRKIATGDESVEVELYPRGIEDAPIESTYAFFQDAEEEICSFHGVDIEDVAEWVGLHYQQDFATQSFEARYEWIKRYLAAHLNAEGEAGE